MSIKKFVKNHPQINPYRIFMPGIFRAFTAPIRVLPDFIIIGASRCGTTSFYNYLIQHPLVFPAKWKELHYFDYKRTGWYRTNFPTIFSKFYIKKIKKKSFVTGESSPYYFLHPLTAERVKKKIPKVKLIVLLRNPVDRAYSDYKIVSTKYDPLSFEEAIKQEQTRLKGEREKLIADESYKSRNFQIYSYLTRGMYFEQLNEWLKYFPQKQFHIIKTEDLKNNPQQILDEVFKFLHLPSCKIEDLSKQNIGISDNIDSETKKYLLEYFKSHNEKLYKLLGRDFQWNQ